MSCCCCSCGKSSRRTTSKIKIPNNITIKENLIYSLLNNSVKVSHEINTNLIIFFTDEIKFAKILSKFRPPCITACPTKCLNFKQVMRLIRGIVPFYYEGIDYNHNEEELIKIVVEHLLQENIIQDNVNIIVINAFVNNNKKLNYFNSRNGMYICNKG